MNQASILRKGLSRNLVWITILFCLLGGALRFFQLGGQGLWTDELHTVEIASRDPVGIWQTTRLELHPPLYNVLLHPFTRLLPPTESTVRLLSALCGLAVIPLLGAYLTRNYGPIASIVGMLFVSTAPVQVFYSQEARPYAVSMLFTVISLMVVRKVNRERTPAAWLMYTIVAIIGVYLNYFLAALLLAQFIWLGLQPGMWRDKWLFISALVTAGACLPLVPSVLASQEVNSNFNQLDSWGIEFPSTFESMLIGDDRYVPRPGRWAAFAIFVCFGLVAAIKLRRRSLLYLLILALPTLATFIVLPLMQLTPPAYQERQFIVLAPVAWILVAVGISEFWERPSTRLRVAAGAVCVCWVGIAGFGLTRYFGTFVKSDERAMVGWFRERTQQRPILVAGHRAMGGAFRYYAPDTRFLYTKRWDSADPVWIPDQAFAMFPLSPPSEQCILTNIESSRDLWLVEYVWLPESASFARWLEQTRPIDLVAQIGNYQIYEIAATLEDEPLLCEDAPSAGRRGVP